jgi:hypothetical protein
MQQQQQQQQQQGASTRVGNASGLSHERRRLLLFIEFASMGGM